MFAGYAYCDRPASTNSQTHLVIAIRPTRRSAENFQFQPGTRSQCDPDAHSSSEKKVSCFAIPGLQEDVTLLAMLLNIQSLQFACLIHPQT